MADDDFDDFEPDEPAPRSRRKAQFEDDPPEPGVGRVLLWAGAGCFAFVTMLGGACVLVIWLLISLAKDIRPADGAAPPGVQQPAGAAPAEAARVILPDGRPLPPLKLPVPPPPSSRMGRFDLTTLDVRELMTAARQFGEKGDFRRAIQCQYQAVVKDHSGQYNLACYYSLAGRVPESLYWLQVGAQEESADADWATRDSDLVNVRNDPRWPVLLVYLRDYQTYWAKADISETSLVLPRNAAPGQALPVFIGLHGMGHNAHGFVDAEMYQSLADSMQVAFLGVSGTVVRGRTHFVWSEDPVKDLARIDAALKEVTDRLTPAPGQAVLFGFSQGGLVSAELAARHPDRFAGAIIMSPGGNSSVQISEVMARPEHKRQGIVAVCGAGEQAGNVTRTNEYAAAFEKLGARVYLKLYPDVKTHRFPADFVEKLPAWGKFILDPQAPVPAP